MRSRIAKSTLAEIAAIRGAQRSAAEAQAARASFALTAKKLLLEKNKQRRLSSEERWDRIASTLPLEVEILQLCASDVLRQESAFAQTETEVAKASQDLDRNIVEWVASVRRHESAEKLLGDARKAEVNRRDEVSMQDALDRHAWRRSCA